MVYIVKGNAGTGKTHHIVEESANTPNSIIVSYTNKAVAVVRKMALNLKLPVKTATIHSAFYSPIPTGRFKIKMIEQRDPHTDKIILNAQGQIMFRQVQEDIYDYLFDPNKIYSPKNNFGLDRNKLVTIFVDETSMVGPDHLDDLFQSPHDLYFVGDPNQLPPVTTKDTIANLTTSQRQYIGWFERVIPNRILTTIWRQQTGSPIIDLSNNILKTHTYPSLWNVPDLLIADLHNMKLLFDSVDINNLLLTAVDLDSIIIAYMNKSVGLINNRVRRKLLTGKNLLHYHSGDKLYVNKKYKDVSKGTMLVVDKQISWDNANDLFTLAVTDENKKSFEIVVRPMIIFDEATEKYKKTKPTNWSIEACDVSWGFCLTAHKSQGSQWSNVIVCDDGVAFNNLKFRTQWLYTSVTRAKKSLIVIKGEIK
jgi:exodeoxyribonuclease-5